MKKKKKFNYKLSNLQNKIHNNNNILCDFDNNILHHNINTNSCFNFSKASLNQHSNLIPNTNNYKDIPKHKSKIVNMIVNKIQHNILQQWFDSYIEMYNTTINFINKLDIKNNIKKLKNIYNNNNKIFNELKILKKKKSDYNKTKLKLISLSNKLMNNNCTMSRKCTNIAPIVNTKIIKSDSRKKQLNRCFEDYKNLKDLIKINGVALNKKSQELNNNNRIKFLKHEKLMSDINWKKLRSKHLKAIRDNIQLNSSNTINDKIRIHVLDAAIKTACSAYKSCITNYLNNHIKQFRIKYWSFTKNKKILEIEKEAILNGDIYKSVFGTFNYKYNRKPFQLNSDNSVKIMYSKDTDKYELLISEIADHKTTESKKYISIDQGIKPFIACRTNNELIKIGDNMANIIGKYLKRIDNINNADNLTDYIKKRKEKKCYRKINNKVNEMHWKTIKYITDNYGTVLIGNISMKEASNKKKSNINKELKRIGLMLRLSQFRQRLEYKCLINGLKMEIVDESYTSQVCSKCGNCKRDLGGNKLYECNICNVKRDRDYNSATNIILLKL